MNSDATQTISTQEEQALQPFLPAVTNREITPWAAESGETARVTVLHALEAYGFHGSQDAVVDRRMQR